jgi:hypothetical protein
MKKHDYNIFFNYFLNKENNYIYKKSKIFNIKKSEKLLFYLIKNKINDNIFIKNDAFIFINNFYLYFLQKNKIKISENKKYLNILTKIFKYFKNIQKIYKYFSFILKIIKYFSFISLKEFKIINIKTKYYLQNLKNNNILINKKFIKTKKKKINLFYLLNFFYFLKKYPSFINILKYNIINILKMKKSKNKPNLLPEKIKKPYFFFKNIEKKNDLTVKFLKQLKKEYYYYKSFK